MTKRSNIFSRFINSIYIVNACIFVIALFLFFSTSSAENTDAKKKINPTNKTFELYSPIVLNTQILGTLDVSIDPHDAITVDYKQLLTLIGDKLNSATIESLSAEEKGGRISATGLRQAGLDADFDMSRLSLNLRAHDSMLSRQVLSIANKPPPRSDVIQPSSISGFLNFEGSASISNIDEQTEDSWKINSDGKIRLLDTVLGFEGTFQESTDGSTGFARSRTYLLHDFPNREVKLTLGDVFSSGHGFQASQDLLGVKIGRDYELALGRNIRPLGRRQFSLGRQSVVSVIVDGNIVKTLELPPGRYDLQDIPLAIGINSVSLSVKGEDGSVETLDFKTLFDSGLLGADELDFSFIAGVLAKSDAGGRSYNSDQPVLSAHARTGILDWITLSANAQWTKESTLLGIETLTATSLGPVRLNLATAKNSELDPGWAVGLDFESILIGNSKPLSISLSSTFKTANFTQRAETTNDTALSQATALGSDEEYIVAGQTTLQFSDNLSSSAGFVLTRRNEQRESTQLLYSSISGRLAALTNIRWSLRIEGSSDSETGDSTSFSLGLIYKPTRSDAIYSSVQSKSNLIKLGYNRKVNSSVVGGYTTDLEVQNSSDGQTSTLTTAYTGNRFLANVDLENDQPSQISEISPSSRANLGFQTSFAFADRAWSFGRPITDSFAIINPHKTLEDREIRINPNDSVFDAKNSWLGGALVPNLGRYSTKTIDYSVEDLPLGYDLGSGLFAVAPPQGAGYDLTVGSAATVTVIGILTDASSGDVLPLVTGKVVNTSSETEEPIIVFTNRSGKFAISGIAPGTYTLKLDNSGRNVNISIPDDGNTLLRLGTVLIN